MKKKEICIHYIKERYLKWFGWLFIAGSFFAVAALNKLENTVSKMSYTLIILVFFYVCHTVYDFSRYSRMCRELWAAKEHRGESDYHLPIGKFVNEMLYQEMIRQTEEEKRQLISKLDERRQNMADYYSMWAHQIKTPIAAMRLLLQREDIQAGHLLRAELFKTEQYVEMALQYVRLENIGSDMILREYDLQDIVRQAVKKYSMLFIGSRLSFSFQDFSYQIVTDEKWFSFLIEQLLSNAIKYTKQGSISIRLQRDGELHTAEPMLIIEDTGIGIPESDLPRIFERGFTGYNGRMDKKSTGIGLYLCKQIADKIGFFIKVESVVNQGTKVMLTSVYNVTKM